MGSGIREYFLQVLSHLSVNWSSESCECVQGGLEEDREVVGEGRKGRETISRSKGLQIKNMVANCHGWSFFSLRVLAGYNTEGDIGQGEMAGGGDGQPGTARSHGKNGFMVVEIIGTTWL